MMYEIFLKAISIAILKKALRGAGLGYLANGFQVISYFDALSSISDSPDLGVLGVEVGYDILSQPASDYLVNNVMEDRYQIERTGSGLYATRSRIVPSRVYVGESSGIRCICYPCGKNPD